MQYKNLLDRILLALGHRKLNGIHPTNLIEFYKNLSEEGVRLDYKYRLKKNIVTDTPDIRKKLVSAKISENTLRSVLNGGNVIESTAKKVSASMERPLNQLFDLVGTDKKLSTVTIHRYHELISSMLSTAVQWQLIEVNPADRVKPPKIERKEANYYNLDEVDQMLIYLDSEPLRYQVMIYTVLLCGLRLGELVNLEWTDIDFDNNTISVSKQLQYLPNLGIYELNSTKTDAGNRIISFPPILADLLLQYKAWQDEEIAKIGSAWANRNKLFTKDNGEPIFPDTPSKWFHKFIKKHQLPPLTFHQIRHTNASLLISQGVDIATVSKRLGHADIAVALRTYIHAIRQYDQEAASKLQSLIKKKDK